jgi:SGNH hydrolase-like domain, acetyltransferase AlgX
MTIREHYEQGQSVQKSGALVLVLGLTVAVLLAGDWFMRFYWFRWQDTVYFRPVTTADRPVNEAADRFTATELPASRGGDLSRLIGVPGASARFEEDRPPATITLDPQGFRSLPYELDATFDYIVVGDSYMAEGVPLTNQISSQLSARLGKPVLNRAFMGRGPFQSLMLWIEQSLADGPRPAWIIWGFVERDISGDAFSGYVYLINRYKNKTTEVKAETAKPSGFIFYWTALRPSVLRKSLPNSSALAQISRKMWTHLNYYLFRQLPPDVFVIHDKRNDAAPILGYQISLDSMYWPAEVRKLDQVVWSIEYIRDFLQEHGIQLLVVPIPDKEQIYRDAISAAVWKNGIPPNTSIIPELIARLDEKNIASVNLLELFNTARISGISPYWRDDTHWNNRGIGMAAGLIAERLRGIIAEDEKGNHIQ